MPRVSHSDTRTPIETRALSEAFYFAIYLKQE